MADDEDDLYDDEFDFVDDLDNDDLDNDDRETDDREIEADDTDQAEVESPVAESNHQASTREEVAAREDYIDDAPDEEEDPYATPPPAANYVVHIYEYRQFKRTIDRPFTGEDAESFASEYNRTAKPYGRFAIAGKNDAKPHKSLDDR
jgi:hypothetical protein